MNHEVLSPFDQQLLALLRPASEGISCGPLCKRLLADTGEKHAPSKVYLSLHRMEGLGLVSSRWTTDPLSASKRRKVYSSRR